MDSRVIAIVSHSPLNPALGGIGTFRRKRSSRPFGSDPRQRRSRTRRVERRARRLFDFCRRKPKMSGKRMTKAQVITEIAEFSELDKKSVTKVFDGLTELIKKQ